MMWRAESLYFGQSFSVIWIAGTLLKLWGVKRRKWQLSHSLKLKFKRTPINPNVRHSPVNGLSYIFLLKPSPKLSILSLLQRKSVPHLSVLFQTLLPIFDHFQPQPILPPLVPPICLLSPTIPSIHHSSPFHSSNPSFCCSHPSPTLSPLRTTLQNPSFCGNPSLCDEDDYFRGYISDEDKDDYFCSYLHDKDRWFHSW